MYGKTFRILREEDEFALIKEGMHIGPKSTHCIAEISEKVCLDSASSRYSIVVESPPSAPLTVITSSHTIPVMMTRPLNERVEDPFDIIY
jgi:hypothetical protein